jgi:hypothetical protein
MRLISKISAFGNRLSVLDVFLISLVVTLAFFLNFNFHLSPLYHMLFYNSDALFIEDVARDLNAGGNLFEWRLTQAPYIFPDIFAARLLVPFTSKIGQTSLYYLIAFGLALVCLLGWICRILKLRPFFPVLLAWIVYSSVFTGNSTGDEISTYFGLLGFHSGILIPILVSIAAALLFLQGNPGKPTSLLLMFLFVFLGVLSDSLVAVALLPPLFLFALICWWKKEGPLSKVNTVFGVTLFASVLGKAFGYTNPFPQDREFMRRILSSFISPPLVALKKFLSDMLRQFANSLVFDIIAILFVIACVFALYHLIAVMRSKAAANTSTTLLSLFVIVSPMVVIIIQISIGLYVLIDLSRQWAPLIYLSIVFGGVIAAKQFPLNQKHHKIFLAALTLAFIALATKTFYANKGRTLETNRFVSLAECMKENGLPTGSLYIADYWLARPLRLHSEGAFRVSPYFAWAPFTNASNILHSRNAHPRFIITGISIDYNEVINRFGEPDAEYCKMNVIGHELQVLDFSSNEQVKAFLRNNAVHTY